MITRLVAALALVSLAMPAHAERFGLSVTSFDRLQVNGAFTVVLTTGRGSSGYIEGHPDAINRIAVSVTGRTLRVRRNVSNNWGGSGEGGEAVLHLTTPSLDQVTLIGSGDLSIDRMEGGRLTISLGGNGRISVGHVETDNLALALTGAGVMEIGGHAETGRVTVHGPGTVNAPGLTVENVRISLDGPGLVEIDSSREAEIVATGTGSVTVTGNAACTDRSVNSGQVMCGGTLVRR